MSNITKITTGAPPAKINEDVVELLHGLLHDAEEGRLIHLAYAGVSSDGSVRYGHANGEHDIELMASVAWLHGKLSQSE